MNNELGMEDPLLQAISDLRCFVDQLIDEQIVHLTAVPAELDHAHGSLIGGESAETYLKTSMSSSADLETVLSPLSWDGSLSRVSYPASFPSATVPAAAALEKGTASVPAATSALTAPDRPAEDPRKRLDALAKHLDDRLRRVRDLGPDRSKPDAEN